MAKFPHPQGPLAGACQRCRGMQCTKGKRKIAVKVVDIFGNDTMKVVEVNV